MDGVARSTFHDLDDYLAALRTHGELELVAVHTRPAPAALTQIFLPRMSLAAGDEQFARVAWVRTPVRRVRITLPAREGAMTLGGLAVRLDEIVIHRAQASFHERSAGPCSWRLIDLPGAELLRYGRAAIGGGFDIPPGASRWKSRGAALARLIGLHDNAMAEATARSEMVDALQAARGLEQEVLDALLGCLDGAPEPIVGEPARRRVRTMAQFEGLLQTSPEAMPSVSGLCSALAVSERTLEMLCTGHLGMGPRRYINLRRMQHARWVLRHGDPSTTHVGAVAARFGFRHPGRFATAYRDQFGEAPSETVGRRPSA